MWRSLQIGILCGLGCAMTGSRSLGQATQPVANAADFYLKAGELLAANDAKNIMSPAASSISYPDYPPFPAQWQRMEKEDFAANQAARELAHQARSIDRADWPPIKKDDVKSYYLNRCRNLANELGDAALYQHLQGDDAAAVETIRDLLHLADSLEHSDSKRTLVNALVSAGIRSLAMDRLNVIMAGAKLTKDPNEHRAVQASVVRELIDYQLQRPDAEAMVAELAPEDNPQTTASLYLGRILTTFGRVNVDCALSAVSMACHLYRLDTGHWPKSMDDLRKYLSKIPIDPFGNGKQTVGYALIKGGLPDGSDRPLVYARGDGMGTAFVHYDTTQPVQVDIPPARDNELFFRTDRPEYGFYTDGDPNAPHAKQMRGGQFRDVTAWVPKEGAAPATQPLP